jgi:hypothetical protein
VNVFNKRNALVGFLALKMIKRRLRRNGQRKAPKIAFLSVLGLGAIVGIVAVVLRRRGEEHFAHLGEEQESEIVGEYVTASSSPIPAT